MSQAQHTHRRATQQVDTSRKAHDETVYDNLNMYNELHSTMEHKVRNSYRLIEKMQKRADSLEGSIQQTRLSLTQLETALRSKEAPLQLCMWRMEQRERRPLREQVRDAVELALEEEKTALMQTQRKLSDAIKRTKNTILGLEGKLEEVRHDIDQKTQALSVDEMCLRTTHRSYQTVVGKTPPRSTASSRLPSASKKSAQNQVAAQESSRNEVARQQEAVRLNHTAQVREDQAKVLRDDNAKLVQRCDRIAEEAVNKSERCLQDRVNENQGMRRRLELEIRETLAKMENTKNTIAETRSQIRSLEEPIENCNTCASWRKQRATREHIHDPVSTKLQEHQMTLLRSHEELTSHHQTEKQILQDLQERKERLKEDLRDKTAALHIDLNCLTHEATYLNGKPSKTLSKSKISKAMKVDSTFVPIPNITIAPVYGSGAMTAR
jgi:chromosome segregation ATPase